MNRNKFLPRQAKAVNNAKILRKNATKQENHLWFDFLRKLPVRFYRQYTIENYIVDFFCPKADLVIELDGSQHYEPSAIEYDIKRTQTLNRHNLTVFRYTNRDINEKFDAVCEDIKNYLNIHLGLSL